ncbi:hypothetical protein H4R35_000648 [Dimargaris xerosporica]|nr:hypothetical protein H4R35_000648 [Dimargaris xerosporica]
MWWQYVLLGALALGVYGYVRSTQTRAQARPNTTEDLWDATTSTKPAARRTAKKRQGKGKKPRQSVQERSQPSIDSNQRQGSSAQDLTEPSTVPVANLPASLRNARRSTDELPLTDSHSAMTPSTPPPSAPLPHSRDPDTQSSSPPRQQPRVLRIVESSSRAQRSPASSVAQRLKQAEPPAAQLTSRQRRRQRIREAEKVARQQFYDDQAEKLRQHRQQRMDDQIQREMQDSRKAQRPKPRSVNYSNQPKFDGQLVWDQ